MAEAGATAAAAALSGLVAWADREMMPLLGGGAPDGEAGPSAAKRASGPDQARAQREALSLGKRTLEVSDRQAFKFQPWLSSSAWEPFTGQGHVKVLVCEKVGLFLHVLDAGPLV